MRGLILLAAAAGIYFGFRWFVKQPSKTQLQAVAVGIGVLLITLAASGRLSWIFALFGALLPFLRRMLSLLTYLPVFQRIYRQFNNSQASAGQPSGQQSNVETRFLRMTLDHDSGDMNGRVLEGRYAGEDLQSLSLKQLLELLGWYDKEDAESAALLRAYLDRVHGDSWQEREQARDTRSGGFSGSMSRHEAYDILGLDEGASEKQIVEAHRRLMQKLHPDRGGSTFLAAKINQAKDLLLGGA
ncbi:MAG: DnaJ domain-containing protein [Thiogranum sp.]